jgi:hypothetical protein
MRKHQQTAPAAYADSWHTGGRVVAIVHLRANRDSNGNPRRVFVGIDKQGHVIATTDEGFAGDPAWVRDARDGGVYAVGFDTEVAEYTRQMARVERHRGRFALVKAGDEPTEANIYARAWTRDRARRLRRAEYAWAKGLTIVEVAA